MRHLCKALILTFLITNPSVCRNIGKHNIDEDGGTRNASGVDDGDLPFREAVDEKIMAQNKQELLRRKNKLLAFLEDAAGRRDLLDRVCKYLEEKYYGGDAASKGFDVNTSGNESRDQTTGNASRRIPTDETRAAETSPTDSPPGKRERKQNLDQGRPEKGGQGGNFLINEPRSLKGRANSEGSTQIERDKGSTRDPIKVLETTSKNVGNYLDVDAADVLENPETINFSMSTDEEDKETDETIDDSNAKNDADGDAEFTHVSVAPRQDAGKRSVVHNKRGANGDPALRQESPYYYHDVDAPPDCALRKELLQHSFLEDKHIQDIREELAKLKELVQIVRDQQYMINLLKEDAAKPQPYPAPAQAAASATTLSPEEFLMMQKLMQLMHAHRPDVGDKTHLASDEAEKTQTLAEGAKRGDVRKSGNQQQISNLRKEIDGLKSQVNARTGDSSKLESELKVEREEIEALKKELENLTNVRDKPASLKLPLALKDADANAVADPVLGAKHVDVDDGVGKKTKSASQKARASVLELLKELDEGGEGAKGKEDDEIGELQRQIDLLDGSNNVDASAQVTDDDADVIQLLKSLDGLDTAAETKTDDSGSDPTAMALKLLEVQERMEKKKEQLKQQELENRLNALNLKIKKKKSQSRDLDDDDLGKLSKSFDDDEEIESEIRKLKKQLHAHRNLKKQGKDLSDDDDLQTELASLQVAIHKLQPKDDLDLDLDPPQPEPDSRHLSSLLTKLLVLNKLKPAITSTKQTKLELLKKKLLLLSQGNKNTQQGGGMIEGPGGSIAIPGNFPQVSPQNRPFYGPYGPYPWPPYYGPGPGNVYPGNYAAGNYGNQYGGDNSGSYSPGAYSNAAQNAGKVNT